MCGFILGTVCLFGLVKLLRCGRHRGCGPRGGGYFGGHCGPRSGGCHGGHDAYGGGGGGPFARGDWHSPEGLRWLLRPLFERLVTTPGQEKVMIEAAEGLRTKLAEVREVLRASGSDTAKAFRAERFDEASMGDAFARQNAALESVQRAGIDALMKVHEALDDRQRRDLADLMDRGVGFFGRWGAGAPYRF